jgi:hypothetical protein
VRVVAFRGRTERALDVWVVVKEREEYGNPFDNRSPELGLDSSPIVIKPPLNGFELRFLLGRSGILTLDIFRLPLDGLRFQHGGET